jgi:hypothetical protein
MRSCCAESSDWQSGTGFLSVSLGPFGEEELLRMAELTRDFHPVRLVRSIAKDAGFAGLVLHPAWVSGLADTGIRMAFPCGQVMSLSLRHRTAAVHADVLRVELTSGEPTAPQDGMSISFVVKNGKGIVVAEGEARIILHPPQ